MKKIYIAMSVTHSLALGVKASSLGVFYSEEVAKAAIHDDMENWREYHKTEGVEVDFSRMTGWYDYDPTDCCKWTIMELDFEVS